MQIIKYNDALKEIRKNARKNGLIFKKNLIEDKSYCFIDKETQKIIYTCSFWNAYENCQSGGIDHMGLIQYNKIQDIAKNYGLIFKRDNKDKDKYCFKDKKTSYILYTCSLFTAYEIIENNLIGNIK